MKASKSLREVWDWKKKVYERTKNMSVSERFDYYEQTSEELMKKYNVKLRRARISAH